MSKSRLELKKRILDLLREDEEFRLAVAGFIGIEEVLKGLNMIQQELARFRHEMNRGFSSLERRLDALGARWGNTV